ncbi:sensor histidine kinase [Chromatium okenii]|uniref:sensor histidine kinase n=1 Tax=Chromatium okenii TaxID=61644 RepID=UPI0026EAE026|nr:ATP-binding protein [Chromatium okenii]MBV5310864.1 GHKL domain-containing protein [Chromatium okenii]
MLFDARTGFVYMSAMSVVMALAIWIVLRGQRTSSVWYWCGGGLAVAAGSMLMALRDVLPPIAYELGNLCIFVAFAAKVQSLRVEAGQSASWHRLVGESLLFLVVFTILLRVTHQTSLNFLFGIASFTLMNVLLTKWAWRLWREQQIFSAFWIGLGYAVMTLMFSFRFIVVASGYFHPTILTQGADALVLALASVVVAIISNMGYLGIHLERSTSAKMTAAAAQARAEENQRLSEQLTQLDRQRCLGAMSVSLGHELNQPLAAILTNAQIVQRGLQQAATSDAAHAAPIGEFLERIVSNTQRASQIIERIRGFIRPRPTQCELLALQQLVPEVVKLIAAEARAQRVTITLDPDMPPLRINADSVQLSQILINVLRNAIEALAGAERREIHISLSEETGMAVLRIDDTGAGLSAEALARVGEPFFSTKTSGLGMGITISQTIAAQHGGDLTLTNAPGGGAVATLTLPLAFGNG